MPEGDTVWRSARTLDRALQGSTLLRTDLRVPRLATVDLSGGVVLGTTSRGKHLLTRIDHESGRWTLHTHLKMEGSWHVYGRGDHWRRPGHEARVVLETADRVAVGFALGTVELVARDHEEDLVGHLGPDLLGPDWDEQQAVARLRRHPDRALHEALLDQRNLAGIGNLYANELCFVVGLRPTRPVRDVPDLPRLVRRAQQMLEANKQRVEQTTTGDLKRGRRTWVYRQRECQRCQTSIEVGRLGVEEQERATYTCSRCQR